MKENKHFDKVLKKHKQMLSLIKDGAPEKDINGLNKQIDDTGTMLALMIADFKCILCDDEDNLTRHHVIRRKEKKLYNSRSRWLNARYYWNNIAILCRKCHAVEDNVTAVGGDNMGVLDVKFIKSIKNKMPGYKERKKIIHWLDPALMEHKGLARYVCNQAVFPTANKSTNDPRDITCKNCLPQPNKALQKSIDDGLKLKDV